MSEKEITVNFTLTLTEANKVFKALGAQPFDEVFELIGKLNTQANDQLGGAGLQVLK